MSEPNRDAAVGLTVSVLALVAIGWYFGLIWPLIGLIGQILGWIVMMIVGSIFSAIATGLLVLGLGYATIYWAKNRKTSE